MKKRKENKIVKRSRLTIIGSLFIIVGISLLYGKPIYNYLKETKEIIKIEEFYEQQEEIKQDIKLEEPSQEIKKQTNNDYISVIKIPKINLEKGLCSINSNCNNVNKNIEILKESSYPNTENGNFILAGHSGDSNVSYFKDVDKLSINDEIFIYYGGYEYKYKVVNIYDIEKTGIANIIRNKEKSTLTLITCRDKTDRQIIVISELTEKIRKKVRKNMLNNCVLVGRIAHDIELKESENGNKYAVITLAVPRNYKNSQGEYETDFINVNIWKNIAENTAEYCKKGDIVGVRGRMESSQFEKDGKKEFRLNIFADKVSFLSSRRDKVAESRDER